MADNNSDDLSTKKQLRLTRIAYLAKIFAWIALLIQIGWVVINFLQTKNMYSLPDLQTLFGEGLDFIRMWKPDSFFAALLLAESIGIFFRGVVYWLVLKGVSVGLYMIVETDLNYRERAEDQSNA